MPDYVCPRCGYKSHIRTHIINHFSRKNPCLPKLSNKTIINCYKDIFGIEPPDNIINNNNLISNKKMNNLMNFNELSEKTDRKMNNLMNFNEFLEKKMNNSMNFNELSEKNEKKMNNSMNFNELSEKKMNFNELSEKKMNNTNSKLLCLHCNSYFDRIIFNQHLKTKCKKHNTFINIYKYEISSFGKNIYGKGGGEMFCIQTDFINNYYKIGITTNLYNKMNDLRTNNLIEPRLLFYYPIKNTKLSNKLLKNTFIKYQIDKDTYNVSLNNIDQLMIDILNELSLNINKIIPKFKKDNNNTCIYCNKKFINENQMYEHFSNCQNYIYSNQKNFKCYNKSDINDSNKIDDNNKIDDSNNLNNQYFTNKNQLMKKNNISENSKDQIIDEQARQLEIMKAQIEVLINSNSNSKIQHIHGDQNNVNFYINAFGNENIEYITGNIIQKLMHQGPLNAVSTLLQNIHFHPNHTENHNIFIPNKKDSLAKIYDGTKWVYTKKKEAIEDMANKALTIMEESDNTSNLSNIRELYIDGDKNTVNRINDDTEIMILNQGKNISK